MNTLCKVFDVSIYKNYYYIFIVDHYISYFLELITSPTHVFHGYKSLLIWPARLPPLNMLETNL